MAASEHFISLDFEHFSRDFQRVIHYLEAQRELMDAHMVDYFTWNHWESLLPRQIRNELELLSLQQLESLPTACNHESENFDSFGENLKQFLTEARQAQLKSFSWLRDRREFSSEVKVNFISHIMTPKKSYEVEIMSGVVDRLATQFQVSKILDLGSGKGYLSQYLALQYGLKVIGVDSSHSNTQNAVKRNERLLKSWKGLVRKSQNEKVKYLSSISDGNISSGQCSLMHSSSKCTCFTSYTSCCSVENKTDTNSLEQTFDINDQEGLWSDLTNSSGDAGKMFLSDSKYTTKHQKSMQKADSSVSSYESSKRNSSHESSSLAFESEQCTEVVQNTYKGTYHRNVMQNGCHCDKKQQVSGYGINAMISDSKQPQGANQNSFLPVTGFVDQSFVANGELQKLFDELASSNEDSPAESSGIFVVGLHTCGDLVPMALRIFVNEPSVKLICIVGCCYHLVSQEYGLDSTCTSDDPGFPMSQFLKPFKLHVSRNATMVAQQAADRIASESKLPPPSVLYRAILQVILKEKFGLDGRGMHVGKAGAKCKSFREYVHKCLNKLGLQDRISELSDEELESYHERFKSREKQLHAFHQLRAAIAPCIESVFLLDRLCYLYEQDFKSAYIVRLFDPVKSPRCYAIIASKP